MGNPNYKQSNGGNSLLVVKPPKLPLSDTSGKAAVSANLSARIHHTLQGILLRFMQRANQVDHRSRITPSVWPAPSGCVVSAVATENRHRRRGRNHQGCALDALVPGVSAVAGSVPPRTQPYLHWSAINATSTVGTGGQRNADGGDRNLHHDLDPVDAGCDSHPEVLGDQGAQ